MITLGCLNDQGRQVCLSVMILIRTESFSSIERSYYFIRGISQMKSRLANGEKLIKDDSRICSPLHLIFVERS